MPDSNQTNNENDHDNPAARNSETDYGHWHDYRVDWTPLDAFEETDEQPLCDECGGLVVRRTGMETMCYLDDEKFCEKCADVILKDVIRDAEEFAVSECRITRVPHIYDPSYVNHELGDRPYTRNAVDCHNRHNCTNYESLIRGLSRDENVDRIYYQAIKNRIGELLDTEIERLTTANTNNEASLGS